MFFFWHDGAVYLAAPRGVLRTVWHRDDRPTGRRSSPDHRQRQGQERLLRDAEPRAPEVSPLVLVGRRWWLFGIMD